MKKVQEEVGYCLFKELGNKEWEGRAFSSWISNLQLIGFRVFPLSNIDAIVWYTIKNSIGPNNCAYVKFLEMCRNEINNEKPKLSI